MRMRSSSTCTRVWRLLQLPSMSAPQFLKNIKTVTNVGLQKWKDERQSSQRIKHLIDVMASEDRQPHKTETLQQEK